MKSPIIYYGGKTSMLQYILPLIPEHQVYSEVFVGGATVLFAKSMVSNETINDRLDIVVNFYRQLKTNYKRLKAEIDATCFSRSLHDRALLIFRNPHLFGELEKAWVFWMASNFSYGNKLGGGIKFSNDQSMLPPRVMRNMKAQFTEQLVNRIEHVHIENRDALQVLKSRNVDTAFHYLDPPYFNADMGHYGGYTKQDLGNLLDTCEILKGKFLLSNYTSDLLDEYVTRNNWWRKEFTIMNKGVRSKDKNRHEVLVANYEPVNSKDLFSI